MVKLESNTWLFIGRDDGENFGPFNSTEEALEWAVRQCTADEVLPQYREEAERLTSLWQDATEEGKRDLLPYMMDMVTNVDWVLFGVQAFNGAEWDDVLEAEHVHDPSDSMY